MAAFFIVIYDYLSSHKQLFWGGLSVLVFILIFLTTTLRYSEDIYDFLPLDEKSKTAMTIYQDVTEGNKIVVMFDSVAAIDTFAEKLINGKEKERIKELVTRIDYDKYLSIPDFVYANIPLMLTDSDYVKMEEHLHDQNYVAQQMQENLQKLASTASMMYEVEVSNDPLGLFSPVMERLSAWQRELPFEIDDGYIFTHDKKYAIAMMTTPYGAVESAENAKLVEYVEETAREVMEAMPGVEIYVTGAPVIAVENARQIKKDSILAISIAVVLIVVLLFLSFRNIKSLLWISITIAFGWLFAMSLISLCCNNISIIVLGLGSTIIGIAVNYPLHFMAHGNNQKPPREVLREIVAPLLFGNITTVGAFACLIPLDATALHDLGLFAAFMLVGTILFVLIFLPHLSGKTFARNKEHLLFGKIAEKTPERQVIVIVIVIVTTSLLGYFGLNIGFDANIQNVNYMSETQKQLLDQLNTLAGPVDTTSVYVVSEGETWDEVLDGCLSYPVTAFISSKTEQARRVGLWDDFWSNHREETFVILEREAAKVGFMPDAFDDFVELVSEDKVSLKAIGDKPFEYFEPLTSTLFSNTFTKVNGNCAVVNIIHTERSKKLETEKQIEQAGQGRLMAFDFENLNCDIANALSDNFNYICFACGCIVFLFLWLSFGKLLYAVIAFIPMAVGWIWIIGIMSLLGIEFNIVNVILATFIFGQGDDYTIFIVEGLISEKKYGRKVLPSYRNSIIISALIMFIGIGSLITASHPALHSLAEVTIIGMAVVVLMAWILPPLLYHFCKKFFVF